MELVNQASTGDTPTRDIVMEEAHMTNKNLNYPSPMEVDNVNFHALSGTLGDSVSFPHDTASKYVSQITSFGPSPIQLGNLDTVSDVSKSCSFHKEANGVRTIGINLETQDLHDVSKPNGPPNASSTKPVEIRANGESAEESRQKAEKGSARSSSLSKSLSFVKVEENEFMDDGIPAEHPNIKVNGHKYNNTGVLSDNPDGQEPKRAYNKKSHIPRSSIPQSIPPKEYARQCILAAYSSRLNPYALHAGELSLLRDQITRPQVTIYLNIRNAILRLWTRNPLVSVSFKEALGCAKDNRHFGLAKIAYYWLLRNGYVNFGCVENAEELSSFKQLNIKPLKQRTVVVIGAGMAGLGCSRQLKSLFACFADRFAQKNERPPRIIVIEGRNRIGGRIYSHPLRKQASQKRSKEIRATAEMGAQIITGFNSGNPLNAIVRGQLALPYHSIRDNSILFDYDGTHVDKNRDTLIEKIYNDILEKVSIYRNRLDQESAIEGERRYIDLSKDPYNEEGQRIGTLHMNNNTVKDLESMGNGVDSNKILLARIENDHKGPSDTISSLHSGLAKPSLEKRKLDAETDMSVNLNDVAGKPKVSLGEVVDEAMRQYQKSISLSTQELRLLNWHNANLEYANAANINQLSLGGWDQDIGNEFEGEHTEIIGGYLQVLRGLWKYPTELDVRFKHRVKKVICSGDGGVDQKSISLICDNGSIVEADQVVVTTPLGVLKWGDVQFEPPLPAWKSDCIKRIGFGLLNKIILVYEEMFWEEDRDMFGLLNQSSIDESLRPEDYAAQRGRFYLFWNCTKTSGVPVLIALMAGDSAVDVEKAENEAIISEITLKLQKMYPLANVPQPSEVIITRWQKDPMARGSYSYVAPDTLPGDYGLMAQSVGPIRFAGEATCGSHPATVHGAYLSGLRAANEVIEDMIGAIEIPQPLVEVRPHDSTFCNASHITSQVDREKKESRHLKKEAYEVAIVTTIEQELGGRPTKPARTAANPYLLFQKDYWFTCKAQCDEERRKATQNPQAKASRNTIRAALGQKWRSAPVKVKEPYLERAKGLKENTTTDMNYFRERLLQWDRDAERIRKSYIEQNPFRAGR